MTGEDQGPGHLASLREAIDTDTYQVDAIDVADALLRRWRMDDVVDRFRAAQDDGSVDDISDSASR